MPRTLARTSLLLICIVGSLPILMGTSCPTNPVPVAVTDQAVTDPNTPTNPGVFQGDRTGIYVTNFSGDSVTVYALDASGDAAPKRTIVGPSTGLNDPLGIAKDSQSRIYVANRSGGKVTAYPYDASGDAAPTRTLTDPNMGSPEGLVTSISDEVFVTNCPTLGGLGGIAGVYRFLNSDTAADFSIAGANTGITVPVGIAIDEARNLFVANAFGGNVSLWSPGQNGNQFPVQAFNPGGNTQSIAYGSASILLGNGSSGINLYHSNSSGNTAWVGQIPNVGYTGGIFFDVNVTPPMIYVADFSGNAIHVIQTVGTPPFLSIGTKTTIKGPSTGLKSPYGVLVIKS